MLNNSEISEVKDEYFQFLEGLCPEHATTLVLFLLAKRLQRVECALFCIEKTIETIHMPDGSAKTFGTKKDVIGDADDNQSTEPPAL